MDNSPFNRSSRTARSPPPSHARSPATTAPPVPGPDETTEKVISTPELQSWMSSIEQCLSQVCSVASEGKLNTDQKLRISDMCRKVLHGTSNLVVQYQSLKMRTLQAHNTIQTLQDQRDLSESFQDLKRSIEESAPSTTTFADMVKKGSNLFVQPPKINSVAIYPGDKSKTSEDTKSLVQKIICPEKMKLQVRGIRKTRDGGVIISTENKEDLEKLKQSHQLKNSGFKIDEPHKRKPRLVIIGVPTTMPDKEVFNCIYQQNLADLCDFNYEAFIDSIKLSHKSGNKNSDSCNYIVEVTPSVRKALITKSRIFVNWTSCPVRDFTLVTRCYKCQQYGHAAKTCRESSSICGHCGEQGHTIKECTKRGDEPKCASCLQYKKPHNHPTGAIDCPAKIMAEKRYINSVDYGGA